MKRFFLQIALVLTIALIGVACGDDSDSASEGTDSTAQTANKEPIKIGAVFSQSGPLASLGQAELTGARIAVKEINDKGGIGNRLIELVVKDPASNADEAVRFARELVVQDRVMAVVGPESTTTGAAMMQVMTEAGIPSISLQGGVDLGKDAGTVFGNGWTGTTVVKASIEYLKSKNITKVGYLSTADALGQAGEKFGLPLFQQANIQVVKQTFAAGATDLTAQLSALQRENVGSVFLWATGAPAVVAAKNFTDLRMSGKLLLLNVTTALASQFGPASASVLVAQPKLLVYSEIPSSDPQYKAMSDYAKVAQANSLNAADPYTANGYGAIKTLAKSIEQVGADPAKIVALWKGGFDLTDNPAGRVKWSDTDHQGFNPADLVMVQYDATGKPSRFTG
jgi:branched-chain amino acid transport system substrate-binding protein